jgi:hypothetical protein
MTFWRLRKRRCIRMTKTPILNPENCTRAVIETEDGKFIVNIRITAQKIELELIDGYNLRVVSNYEE